MVTKFQLRTWTMLRGQQECWPFSAELTEPLVPVEFVTTLSSPGEILWVSWGDTSDRWLPGSQQMGLDKVMLMVFCLLQ